ncbi:putative bifunctional diguanylate cyclase/phosphodiesterase [Undibacterium sp. Ren11W]|uniref:putative bifunctional diguanylate cyclase/phosphodiesterase n=1 Tax=Undibacterium sp. Ren11W TaxID=3413045 RepID=UPI003BF04858
MKTFFQFIRKQFIRVKHPATDIQHWREEVFSAILSVTLLLGLLTAIPSILLAISDRLWAVIVMDIVAIAWIAILWSLRALSYASRVWNFLLILFLLGVFFLRAVGPVGQIYLMAFPAMAALLLGLRPAVYCLIVNAITLMVVGYFFDINIHLAGLADKPLLRWAVITLNFSLISSVITISCGVLLQRLEKSLKDQGLVADSLRSTNEELRLISAAVGQLSDMVVISRVSEEADGESLIVFVNQAFEHQSGYKSADVLGRMPRDFHGKNTQPEELARIRQAVAQHEWVHSELIAYTKSGEEYWLEVVIQPVADSDGKYTHEVMVGRDITARKKADSDIHSLAYFDVLTGLPNRRLLLDRIGVLLATAQRSGLFSAVLFIDLDHFKYINDARGHATGDAVLRAVAKRLSNMLREVDTVARIGGDEFVALIANVAKESHSSAAIALSISEKIRAEIAKPFEIDAQTYTCGCSIGVTLMPKPGQTKEDLLRESDTAMYRAKMAGRNQIAFFEENMQVEVENRLTMVRDLANAIANEQMQMFMQAQVDSLGNTVGAELLMRWTHPTRGAVSPAEFIPVAEESGIIVQLGDWVLQQACLVSLKLTAQGRAFPLSINVSPKQFRQIDFVEKVRFTLQASGADPAALIFEVTEGLLIDNLQETIIRMRELCQLGIRFSIDDFGTGYSSLFYLKRLPLYELKIDKSFIRDTPTDPSDTAIVQAILAMAKHLGLRVVAEGVETREQADFLIASACDSLQGYLFSRPLPVDAWLQQPEAASENMLRLADK